MTRVLVTGGAGFLGSHVVDRLLSEGHAVTALDDLSTGRLHNLAAARRDPEAAFSFVRLDVTSDGLERAVAKAAPEVVVHLGRRTGTPEDPVRDALVNVVGTVNLLEACCRHGVGKVVVASAASAVYGEPPAGAGGSDEPARTARPVRETEAVHPVTAHGAAEVGLQAYVRAFEARHGIRWTSLVLGSVFGPRQREASEAGDVVVLAGRMLAGRDVTVHGDGEASRDLLFVADAVDAVVAAVDAGDGAVVNVGSGTATSVNELVGLLAERTGYDRAPIHAPAREDEPRSPALDVSRAREALGWTPTTSLADGLGELLTWLRG